MEKRNILFNGLMNFGKYGEDSRLRDIYSIKELQNIKPSDLVQKVKDLQDFKHRIFYYGNDVETANSAISNQLQIVDSLKEYPDPKNYNEKDVKEYMKWDSVHVEVNLNIGSAIYTVYTCDFTHEYININADYRN